VLDPKLQDALADRVLEAVQPLVDAHKLASFLLQLSPGFAPRCNELDELAPLIERLAPHPVAIEPRRNSWVRGKRAEETLGWMEEHGAVWVCTDAPDADHLTIMPPLDAVTNPQLAYFRAHGRNADGYIRGRSVAERFAWRYKDAELKEIAERVEQLASTADNVRLMFNNNAKDYAPRAAERYVELFSPAAAR
jgi:uncharacterized protein YecE (DUF72 family)